MSKTVFQPPSRMRRRCQAAGMVEIRPGRWVASGAGLAPRRETEGRIMTNREQRMKFGKALLGNDDEKFKAEARREFLAPGFVEKLIAVKEGRRNSDARE